MGVVGIIVTVVQDLDIWSNEIRFLCKFLFQILFSEMQRTAEHEIAHSEGEDILAPYDCLQVHSAVFQALLCKRSNRSPDDVVVLQIKFLNRIKCLEAGLLQTLLVK